MARVENGFRFEFVFEGNPLTKSNAHSIGWSKRSRRPIIFVKKNVADYEKSLKEHVKKLMKRQKLKMTDKLVCMTIVYYYGSKRTKDLPNLPKTTCDALNKVVYKDDFQIHELHLYRCLDRKNPRVQVLIEEVDDTTWEQG